MAEKQKQKPQEKTITLFENKYKESELTDNQKTMINHISDLDKKINNSEFNLTQLRFGRQAFVAVLLIVLLIIFILVGAFAGCRGASIAGYSIKPDTTKHNSTIFNEIQDQDSTIHWFTYFYDGELWCYYHNRYEMVRYARR